MQFIKELWSEKNWYGNLQKMTVKLDSHHLRWVQYGHFCSH